MAKINISIDDGLLARIDNYADNNYMSRSGLVTLATNQYLNSAEVITAVKEISVCMRQIAENNVVDDETLKELKKFESIASVLGAR